MNFIAIAGLIFGLIGTVLSLLNFISQRNARSADLMMRLRSEIDQTEADIHSINNMFKNIVRRKTAVANANGSRGGGLEKWERQCKQDEIEFNEIITAFYEVNINELTLKKLPSTISSISSVRSKIQKFITKYNQEIQTIESEIVERKSLVNSMLQSNKT